MNILGIGCHPDDLEIACGGTLILYARAGHKVSMCNIACGDMGHAVIMPDELRGIRKKESEAAAKVIGADHYLVDVGDGQVEAGNRGKGTAYRDNSPHKTGRRNHS